MIDYDALLATTTIEDITGDEDTQQCLLEVKSNDPECKSLDIGDEGFCVARTPKEAGWLGYFARDNTVLETILAWRSADLDDMLQYFFTALVGNQSIKSIELNEIDIRRTAPILGKFLKNNKSLTKLTLDGCTLSADSGRNIGDALHGCNKLNTFKLTSGENGPDEDVTDESMASFVVGLSTQNVLEKLELADICIGPRCCSKLGIYLQSTSQLVTLDLVMNMIDDEALKSLAGGLEHCHSLRDLLLNINDFGDDGIVALVNALIRGHVGLKLLDISHNLGCGKGLPNLLRNACTLETLRCDEVDEHFEDITGALQRNRTLKHLNTCRDSNNKEWESFGNALCNTSTINSTFRSNHVLEGLGKMGIKAPPRIEYYLKLNSTSGKKWEVAAAKIITCHDHLDMSPFFLWHLKLFPDVINWFERAAKVDAIPKLILGKKKLASVFQFVRAMPEGFLVNAATRKVSNKRKRIV